MTYLPTFTLIFITNFYTMTKAGFIFDEKTNNPSYLSLR